MIKIKKLKEPEYLKKNKHKPTCKYNNPKVKKALVKECSNKCMYCECLLIASSGQVEHIKPVEKFNKLKLTWSNLGLACQPCNRAKGEKYYKTTPFLNPYQDKPKDFMKFAGPMLLPRDFNNRAEITIKEIELNRKELVSARTERLSKFNDLLKRAHNQPDDDVKKMLVNEINRELLPEKEFTMCLSDFLNHA